MVARLLLVWLSLIAAASPAGAKVPAFLQLSLDNAEIFLGDVVVLEVSSTGLFDPIDFSPLNEVAEVRRQTAGTRIAVTDGQVVEVRTNRIELVPRRVGTLIIGPLTAGDISSNTVKIDVLEDRPVAWTPTEQDIRLDQSVSVEAPWLQQQVVLDIAVRYRHPLSDTDMRLPDLAGFRVVPVYEQRRTLEAGDGGWAVIAWRYLLYPERSGDIVVAGARFSGGIAKSRAERARFDMTAPARPLTVKPAAFPAGQWWLAADDVRMRDDWSGDPRQLSAGDEIERTITVSAEGVLAEQIPDIAMDETGGLAVTPIGEAREGRLDEGSSSATATFRFRVRALSPIPVFLDTVRLRWWNVAENHAEDAILPARRIDIGIPDRDRLLAAAEAEPSALSMALAMLAPLRGALPWLAGGTLATVVALAAFAAMRWHRTSDTGQRDLVRRALAEARRGDTDAFYRSIRALSLQPASNAAVGRLRERFEIELFTGKAPSCVTYGAELKALLAQASSASEPERLPRL